MTDDATGPSELRARGLAKMGEVYSFPASDGPGDFYGMTVEHLFGEVWTREALDIPARRLLTIGAILGSGRLEVLELQFQAALDKGELTPEQVREVIIHLTHYVGWPTGATAFNVGERAINAYLAKAEATESAPVAGD